MALSKYDIEREIEKLKNGTSQKFTIDTTKNDITKIAPLILEASNDINLCFYLTFNETYYALNGRTNVLLLIKQLLLKDDWISILNQLFVEYVLSSTEIQVNKGLLVA